MKFSRNEAINKIIVESIMAISKFFIDDPPDDYVLSIGIGKPKPQKPEVLDIIYLIIARLIQLFSVPIIGLSVRSKN